MQLNRREGKRRRKWRRIYCKLFVRAVVDVSSYELFIACPFSLTPPRHRCRMYIRSLPPQELQQLTGTMSPEVLEAMKGLVSAVLAGIGEEGDDDDAEDSRGFGRGSGKVVGAASVTGAGVEGEERAIGKGSGIGPNTVTEQSGEALARLCMWQLVVGYNLREMEVREKLRASMEDSSTTTLGDDGSDLNNDDIMFGPGVLE